MKWRARCVMRRRLVAALAGMLIVGGLVGILVLDSALAGDEWKCHFLHSALCGFIVTVETGPDYGGGTNDDVYLGLGGVELKLDVQDRDDFVAGATDVFSYNAPGSNLHFYDIHGGLNSIITRDDILNFPVYIRKQRDGKNGPWLLRRVSVEVCVGEDTQPSLRFSRQYGGELNNDTGLILYLRRDQ